LRVETRRGYTGRIGLESNAELWHPYRSQLFSEVTVIGTRPASDREEIVLAVFLDAARKVYLSVDGSMQDIAPWQAQIRPSFRPREVRARRLSKEMHTDYVRRIHRWMAGELITHDFIHPQIVPRHPDISLYNAPHLAADLAQQTLDLHIENHGASFSTLMYLDGTLVHSSDFYRATANFVMAIDGVETVLDVGCGSGFLDCYLAASGRFREVRGVDSSPHRVAGARLHAELVGSSARFDVMSMTRLDLPDEAVDLVVSCFALEQSGPHLPQAIAELRRVARKFLVLFEPSTQFFPTLPGLWHIPRHGWAERYYESLAALGASYAVRPNLFRHYYNPGAVFVIDLTGDVHPMRRLPHLFCAAPEAWPGGVSVS
jgi:SAM-dependent methyltransferase